MSSNTLSHSTKNIIAGKQFYKCANEPGIKPLVPALKGYKCPSWRQTGKNQGSFDESGYEICRIKEDDNYNNDNIECFRAFCPMCYSVLETGTTLNDENSASASSSGIDSSSPPCELGSGRKAEGWIEEARKCSGDSSNESESESVSDSDEFEKSKKPPSEYIEFVKKRVSELKEERPNLKSTERIRICAIEWKEMQNKKSIDSDSDSSNDSSSDSNESDRPKRSMTDYTKFVMNRAKELKEERPNLKSTDRMKMIATEWKEMQNKKPIAETKRPKTEWQLFMENKVKELRGATPGLKNPEYMRMASVEWNEMMNKRNSNSNSNSNSKTPAPKSKNDMTGEFNKFIQHRSTELRDKNPGLDQKECMMMAIEEWHENEMFRAHI